MPRVLSSTSPVAAETGQLLDFKPLITLLAIVPFFIHYTQDITPKQRSRTI